MSLASGFTWTHKDISVTGFSMAGITTTVVFSAADVCFDVGQGLPFQVPVKHIALTHGHMDHASGLPYLIGQKTMHGVPAPHIYMPPSLVAPMEKILALWSEIEDHTYKYQIEGLNFGEERPLKGKYVLKAFPTYHRVASQGYTVSLVKKRLRPAFKDLSRAELDNLRRRGEVLDEVYSVPVLSFTGDTKIEVLDNPEVRASRVLFLECTYWDDRRTVSQAREWGHIHLDEIIPRLDSLSCEKLVLIHSSARYRKDELEKILDRRVPQALRERVELFPRP